MVRNRLRSRFVGAIVATINKALSLGRPKSNGRRLLPVLLRPWAIWRFLADRRAPSGPKFILGAALLYLLMPVDLIPDIAPIIGWLDDAGAVALATGWLVSKVSNHEKNPPEEALDATALLAGSRG